MVAILVKYFRMKSSDTLLECDNNLLLSEMVKEFLKLLVSICRSYSSIFLIGSSPCSSALWKPSATVKLMQVSTNVKKL